MRNRRRRRLIVINSLLAVVVAGGGVAGYLALRQQTTKQQTQGVRTIAVTKGTVSSTVSAAGTVAAAKTLNVDFATAGKISDVKVKAGQLVKKGDVLAQLDTKALIQNRDAADSAVTSAEADLTAARAAVKVDASQVARAQSALVAANTKAEQAQDNVDAATLYAPAAGTLLAVNAEIGGTSTGGGTKTATGTTTGNSAPLFQLTDLTNLQIRSSFTEADTLKLKAGQAATVSLNASPGKPAAATVASIDATSTTQNSVVTYGVTVTFTELPAEVRLGQSATVTVVIGKKDGVLVVPASVIKGAGNRRTATVVDAAGVQTSKPVQVGLEGDLFTEITGGLTEGEKVVLATTGGTTTNTTNQRATTGRTAGTGRNGG